MSRFLKNPGLLCACLLVGIVAQPVGAATRTWDGSSSTAWNTGANWSNNSVPDDDDTARFNSNTSRDPTIGSSDFAVGKLLLEIGADAEVFAGSGTLTLNGVGGVGIENTSGLEHRFNLKIALGDDQTWSTSGADSILALRNTVDLGGRTLTIDTAADSSVLLSATSGDIVSNGAIVKDGAGTLTFVNNLANTFADGFTLNAGTVSIRHNASLGTGTITLAGGTLTAAHNKTLANVIEIAGDATIQAGAAGIDYTFSNSVTGSAGTLTLDSISGSEVSLFNFTGSGVDLGSDLHLADSTVHLRIRNSTGTQTYSGDISGAGQIIQNVAGGTAILSGANTFSGGVTIDAGTLVLANNQAAGSGTLDLSGGTLSVAADHTFANALTLSGNSTIAAANGVDIAFTSNSISGSGGTLTLENTSGAGTMSVAFNGTGFTFVRNIAFDDAHTELRLGNTSGSQVFSGSISGQGRIVRNGTGGATELSEANSFTGGVSIEAGTIIVGHNSSLGTGTATLAGGTLQTDGTTRSLANIISLTGNSTLGGEGQLTLTGGITQSGGNRTLKVTNTAATIISGSPFVLSEHNQARTLTVDVAGASGGLTIDSLIQNGTGTGVDSLVKTGAGTLTLSGENTFSGGVTINAGKLLATGTTTVGGFKALGDYSSVVVPTTVVTVNSGGTLAVQNTTAGWVDPATATTLLLNLSLNGTGADGGGALQSHGGRNTWLGNVSLAGDTRIQNTVAGDNATLFLGPYIVQAPTHFQLNGHDLEFTGVGDTYISNSILDNVTGPGAGNITLNLGSPTANVYFGGVANTYTGDTTINNGTLRLIVDSGNNPNAAILGDLTIGDGLGGPGTATAMLVYSDQIADHVNVTIKSDGKLDLNTYGTVETIGDLHLEGGHVNAGTGALYFHGTIFATTAGTSVIDGQLLMDNFAEAARQFNVASGSTLRVDANIFGEDYIKTGLGTMIVTANNNANGYTGLTTVQAGILNIRSGGALGGVGFGTIVNDGATLQLDNTLGNIVGVAETVTINGTGVSGLGAMNSLDGTNSWAGGILVGTEAADNNATINITTGSLHLTGSVAGTAATAQTLFIAGDGNSRITGPISNGAGGGTLGLTKTDAGTLTLDGVDTFTGAIHVQGGTVAVTANDVLQAYKVANGGVGNAVQVDSGATFAVSGGGNKTNTIGSVTGEGTVSIAGATILKVANASLDTFDGTLTGTGLFEKIGAGEFVFSSTANTSAFDFDGTVKLTNGQMTFEGGSSTDALFIGTLETLADTTLFLDESFINIGTLKITGNTILDFGTGGASVLNATNIYIASGATLTVRNWSSEIDFLFANADFRQTDGAGTLALFNQIGSAPENQVHFEDHPLSSDGSHTTWINYDYEGYTNWEIRPIPEPSTYGALLIGAALSLVGWRRYRRPAPRP